MKARRRKTHVIERRLLIDAGEVLADCWGWSAGEVGRAWLSILAAVADGTDPNPSDELTRVLWRGMRLKQRTGRATISPVLRAAVFERDGYACRYCAEADGPFEADHVIPVSKGGRDDLDNLVCACPPCNRSKGAKLLSEWVGP